MGPRKSPRFTRGRAVAFVALNILLIGHTPRAMASLTCIEEISFLGYSTDWDFAYWEEESGGSCDGGLYIYQYDFAARACKVLFWTSFLPGEEFRPDEVDRDTYEDKKAELMGRLRGVPSGKWLSAKGKVLGDARVRVANTDILTFHDGETCHLSRPLFEDQEPVLGTLISVSGFFHNPLYDSLVVIHDHCNIASPPCYDERNDEWRLSPAIGVYKLGYCE